MQLREGAAVRPHASAVDGSRDGVTQDDVVRPPYL